MDNEDLDKLVTEEIAKPDTPQEVKDLVDDSGSDDEEDRPLSDVEIEARAMGWVPPKDLPSDKKDGALSAEEFIRVKPWVQQVRNAKKQTKALEKTVRELIKNNKKFDTRAKQEAIYNLEQAKLRAVDLGDTERFQQLQHEQMRIASLRENTPSLPDQQGIQLDNTEVSQLRSFREENSGWLNKSTPANEKMILAADALYDWSVDRHPEWDFQDHLQFVEKEIKDKYPERFTRQQRQNVPSVNSGRRSPSPQSSYRYDDLSSVEKKIYKAFEEDEKGSGKDYIKQLTAQRKR